MQVFLKTGLIGALLLTQLAACGTDHAPEAPPVRAVKLEAAGEGGRSVTSFVATVRQERRAELSFEQGGRIASVQVDVGDRVREGQVLATIDAEPVRLQLAQASSREHAARVQVDERRSQLVQQQAMFDDGAISTVTLAAAKTALATAEAELQTAVSERAIAARGVRQASIRAPFAGSVVARLMQPGTVVEARQAVLQLDGAGSMQAVADLPPAVAARLVPGRTIAAQRAGVTVQLVLRSVTDRIDAGGTVQAIFGLPDNVAGIHSGEALTIAFETGAAGAVVVPNAAVLPGPEGRRGNVFVYHQRTSMVERRSVTLGEQRGEFTAIESGLARGERVVTSGATFLVNMQKVAPYEPETRLPREAQ